MRDLRKRFLAFVMAGAMAFSSMPLDSVFAEEMVAEEATEAYSAEEVPAEVPAEVPEEMPEVTQETVESVGEAEESSAEVFDSAEPEIILDDSSASVEVDTQAEGQTDAVQSESVQETVDDTSDDGIMIENIESVVQEEVLMTVHLRMWL